MGLLEHLLVFGAGDRTLMDHLYGANFRRGQIYGPLTVMVFGELQLDSLRRWRHTLMRSSGCLFASALKLASVARPRLPERLQASELFVPRPLTPGRFYLFSDAASDGRSGGGIGGWVHGEWWHLKVSKKNAGLIHITALELIGAGINIILYGDLLAGCDVALCVDALSSAQVIAAGSAHSAALAVVWGLIRALPQYAALQPLTETHVYGEVNVMSDAASREMFDVIHEVASQCGVAARRIVLPRRALDFFNACAAALRRLQREETDAARIGAHFDHCFRSTTLRQRRQ